MKRLIAISLLAAGVAAAAPAQKTGTPPAPSATATPIPSVTSRVPASAASALDRALERYTDGGAHGSPFVQIYTPSGFATARREAAARV